MERYSRTDGAPLRTRRPPKRAARTVDWGALFFFWHFQSHKDDEWLDGRRGRLGVCPLSTVVSGRMGRAQFAADDIEEVRRFYRFAFRFHARVIIR